MDFQEGLVSILMPVYNGEKFLRQAVESVLAQDYPQWELLLADDGSTDGTRQIIQEYADARIRYLYQPNGGQASALNLGLRHAVGEFVTTLDADDWLTTSSLGERVAFLRAHPEFDAVYANGVYTDVDGRPLSRFSEYCVSGVSGDVFDNLIISNMFGTGAAVLQRHEPLREYNLFYDEQITWCQDWDFYLRLAEQIQFGYLDTLAVNYRLHSANMTMQMPGERQRKSAIRTRQKVIASPRFQPVSVEKKREFFYAYLLVTLCGESADQRRVVESSEFAVLPAADQARLVRIVANDYLLESPDPKLCREWLDRALALNPRDWKTLMVSALFNLHVGLARQAVYLYRKRNSPRPVRSPLQQVTGNCSQT